MKTNEKKSQVGSNLVLLDLSDSELYYIFDNYKKLIDQYSAYLKTVGYLEFSHVMNITPQEAAAIGDYARAAGFDPWSIHSEHLNVGDTVEGYLKIQTHEAEVCAALGCKVMVCHLPNLRPYFDFERDVDIIGKVADITGKCGVKLAVETCCSPNPDNESEILPDADLVIRVVEALNRDDVGINLDTGHCLIGQSRCQEKYLNEIIEGKVEQTLPALVKRIGKKLFTTHLQDNFGINDDHQAPCFGYIDRDKLVPAILETGYTGSFMMELTGMGGKARRTVPQLRKFPLEKELIFASSYLNFLLERYS